MSSVASEEFEDAVIIDNGSGYIKFGSATDARPTKIPNIYGKPARAKRSILKRRNDDDEEDEIEDLMGDEVLSHEGKLNISWPMKNGIIENWDQMQSMWEYAYEQMEKEPDEQPVLMTEAPSNPVKNKKKMLEILFEAMDVPAAQIKMQALCSLYAAGKVSGLVLDSGDGVTHAVPIYDGFITHGKGVRRSNVAGRDTTTFLKRLLFQKGYNFTTERDQLFVQKIKEKHCYVAEDFEQELNKFKEDPSEFNADFELPDGQTITLSDERFRASEVLFNPMLIDREEEGIHHMVWGSIKDSEIDARRALMENITLSGGNTMFPGIAARLQSEVLNLAGTGANLIKVQGDTRRHETVFAGAGILANLRDFKSEWVTKDLYDEDPDKAVQLCSS